MCTVHLNNILSVCQNMFLTAVLRKLQLFNCTMPDGNASSHKLSQPITTVSDTMGQSKFQKHNLVKHEFVVITCLKLFIVKNVDRFAISR